MAEPVLKRLKELLLIASQLPLYRDRFLMAGLTPALFHEGTLLEIKTAFQQLPPLDQSEVRQQGGLCLTAVAAIAYRGVTSGTTDNAFIYFRNSTWNALRFECLETALAAWQITPKDTIVNVCSRLFPLRRNDISLIGLPDRRLRGWLKTLATTGGIVIRGYPSRLCELLIQDWQHISVKAVICTGEPLFEHQISLIKEVLGCVVINEYGSQECGLQLWSCPQCDQFHPETQRCWIEVVNQELVVTDLYSDEMPLIRYRNGDRARLVPSTCPQSDWILIPEGRKGEQPHTKQSLPALPHIHYYRIMAEELQGLTLLYLPKQEHVPVLPTHLPGSPPRLVKQWLAVPNGLEFWNQIHPLPLLDSDNELFEERGHSLALSRYIEDCLESGRWIFYQLLPFMVSAQRQLAERQDFVNGLEAQEIDRCLLRLLCHQPPAPKQLRLWLSSLEERYRQCEDQEVPRIEYVALKLLQLGEPQPGYSAIPIDRAGYRSLVALLENVISQARRNQPELPILALTPLLPLFLADLTHYSRSLGAVLEHWAVLLGRLTRISEYSINLPPQLAHREVWLRTRTPKQNLDIDGTKELVEACLQAVLSDCQDRLLQHWTQLEQMTSASLPQPVANCLKASFARGVAAAYLRQGEYSRGYDVLLSTVVPLPLQESFVQHSQLSNGKQRLW